MQSSDIRVWQGGAKLFRRGRLGSSAVAAASARKHLIGDPRTAAALLAEVGTTQDVAAIWQATHNLPDKPSKVRYRKASWGWVAIIRLTNPLSDCMQTPSAALRGALIREALDSKQRAHAGDLERLGN